MIGCVDEAFLKWSIQKISHKCELYDNAIVTHYIIPQNGSTALLVAGGKGHSEVVKLLLQAGARDIRNKVRVLINKAFCGRVYISMKYVSIVMCVCVCVYLCLCVCACACVWVYVL